MMNSHRDYNLRVELIRSGHISELIAHCRGVLRELRARHGDFSLDVAYAFEDLAFAYGQAGLHRNAVTQYQHALEIARVLSGENSLDCARCLSSMGCASLLEGAESDAEDLFQQAVRISNQLPEEQRRSTDG